MVDVGDEMEGCHERLKKDEEEIRRVKGGSVCVRWKNLYSWEKIFIVMQCASQDVI